MQKNGYDDGISNRGYAAPQTLYPENQVSNAGPNSYALVAAALAPVQRWILRNT